MKILKSVFILFLLLVFFFGNAEAQRYYGPSLASPGTIGGTTPGVATFSTLLWKTSTELTISAGGVITATQTMHTVDTNADGATDNLDTITAGTAGQLLAIRAEHIDRTVVVKHNVGNIYTGGADISLDDTSKYLLFVYDGTLTKWVVIGGSTSLASGLTTQILVGGGAGINPVWTEATGTGAPVRATTPTLVTPVLGAATGTSLSVTGAINADSGFTTPQSATAADFHRFREDSDNSTNYTELRPQEAITGNTIVRLPDAPVSGGGIPVLIGRTRVIQNITTAATVDITSSSVVIPASTFSVGKQIHFKVFGRMADDADGGADDNKTLTMTDGTSTINVLVATQDGTFQCDFYYGARTAYSAQTLNAGIIVNVTPYVPTHVVGATDMTAEITLKLRGTLVDAADDIYIDGVDIYFDQI